MIGASMPRRTTRPPRLDDVAREAGVHLSTVSRVLNGTDKGSVRPETRERILEAARRLRYRPNAMARGLKLAQTGALGLLVPSLRNPVYAAIIRGAFDRAWERRFVVVLAEDTGQSAAQAAYERLVEEGRIDGLLIASARPGSPLVDAYADHLVPSVFVNRRHPGSGRNVSMREEDAGRLAAAHLLGLGHRRLGHVAGPPDLDTAARRAAGFVAAVREAGLEPSVTCAPFEERGGHEGLHALLSLDAPPTGIFVSNINQAVGAMAAARAAGRRIPDDVSLVGYDDDTVAEFLDAPLTAIRMPLHELGAVAIDTLLEQLEGAPPRDVTVETAPELVIRASTGPPATP
jgi:DNA-binding LacI/PurR family transcriptional regulator